MLNALEGALASLSLVYLFGLMAKAYGVELLYPSTPFGRLFALILIAAAGAQIGGWLLG